MHAARERVSEKIALRFCVFRASRRWRRINPRRCGSVITIGNFAQFCANRRSSDGFSRSAQKNFLCSGKRLRRCNRHRSPTLPSKKFLQSFTAAAGVIISDRALRTRRHKSRPQCCRPHKYWLCRRCVGDARTARRFSVCCFGGRLDVYTFSGSGTYGLGCIGFSLRRRDARSRARSSETACAPVDSDILSE